MAAHLFADGWASVDLGYYITKDEQGIFQAFDPHLDRILTKEEARERQRRACDEVAKLRRAATNRDAEKETGFETRSIGETGCAERCSE